jgi:hypothetical protein
MQQSDPFALLGVEYTASEEEIAAAWKEKAKKLHPDRFPDVPDSVRDFLTQEMARVNEAYRLLKDDLDGARRRFNPAPGTPREADSQPQRSDAQSRHSRTSRPRATCDICGSLHVKDVKFTRQVGLIFQRRVATIENRLCRSCALAIGRSFQSKTLAAGWWGMISVLTNFGYVYSNAKQLREVSRMEHSAAPEGFRTIPIDPGKEVWRRPLSYVGVGVFALIGVVSAFTSDTSSAPLSTVPGLERVDSDSIVDWRVGNCIDGLNSVIPVSCSSAHTGKIVTTTEEPSRCPVYTEGYVDRDGIVYCIDDDQ